MDVRRSSACTVERVTLRYLVPGEHPAPERVRDRLDAAARPALRAAIAAAAASLGADDDESVVLIRRLAINAAVNAAWDREAVIQRWSSRIARALRETLVDEDDGQNVIRFPNRAVFLARFLTDLVRGDAWGRWSYEAFAGLRMLPVSAAARTALVADPATGLAALAALDAAGLALVLDALTGPDLRRVFDRLTDGAATGETGALALVRSAWLDGAPWPLLDEERAVLRLYVLAWRRDPALAGVDLRRAAVAFIRLAALLANGRAGDALLDALDRGDLGTVSLMTGARDAGALAPLVRAPAGWVAAASAGLRSAAAPRRSLEIEWGETRFTRYGGAFLLLPAIDRLPLADLTGDWPDAGDTGAAAALRWLILVSCLGSERAGAVFDDPLLRELLGVDAALRPADAGDWLRQAGERRLIQFVDGLTAWRADDWGAGREMVLASVTTPGQPVAVLQEPGRGSWLLASGYDPARPARLLARLRRAVSAAGDGAVVYADPALVPLVCGAINCRVEEMPGDNEASGDLAGTIARLSSLGSDLQYLLSPRWWGMARWAGLPLAVAAQGVLRDVAGRLPGFARSSLPYLHRNFLDLPATASEEPGRWVVQLGRPPLNLVLSMTGLARGTTTLSWTAKPLVLTRLDE